MPATFFDIPPEVVEQVLLELDPLDVAACSQTCRDLYSLIYDPANELLWRKLYLAQPFDDPRKCRTPLGMPLRDEDIEWRGRLQRIIRARTVVSKPEACLPEERCTVIQTLLDMARNVPPLPDAFSNDISLNLVWLATLLRGGTFLDQPLWVPSHEETLLRSHLHTLFGLTTHDYRAKRRLESRSFVYDFRNYCAENEWAPLIPDRSGRVNWEHVLAIHHVISMHLVPPGEPSASSYTISPMSLPFTQSILPPDLDLDNTNDWAGIAGRWSCAFCFVDHRELLAYNVPAYSNFFGSRSATHDPSVFANPDFDEIFGGLILDVTVTSTEHDPAHPTRPIIHFEGLADTAPNVKGWVRATPDDNIRWFFESGEGQAHRVWSSHGIVVGNVRSPYGVLGTWTSFQHQNGDPVGPFWMRKIPEAAP